MWIVFGKTHHQFCRWEKSFGDQEGQFVTVDWCEVDAADPQVILGHCFHTQHDGFQKIAFLKQIPKITNTEAMRNDRIHFVGIKKVFPALDYIETAMRWVDLFRNTAVSAINNLIKGVPIKLW